MASKTKKSTGYESPGSEPKWTVTKGKILTGVAGFSGSSLSEPPSPKMRGDAKEIGTGQFPKSEKNASSSALGAFGFTKRQDLKGG